MDEKIIEMFNNMLDALGNYVDKDGLLYFKQKIDGLYAKKSSIPTKVSQLQNDSGYIDNTALSSYAKKTDLPTKTSDLTNDSNFLTSVPPEYITETELTGKGYQNSSQVQSAIKSALSGITGIDFQVVSSLPQTGKKGTIYLMSNSGSGQNIYDEYIWVNNKYEKIGTTSVDLSNYFNTSNFTPVTNGEIDAMF